MTDVPVRDAATVVVARDGAAGLEVLLLRRTSRAVFVGGAHVFPGGALDPGDGGDLRRAAVREAEEEAALRLDAADLRFLARWVTPPGQPRRFDTRFFVAAEPPGQHADCDGSETVECGWWRPDAALAAPILLIEPTRATLEVLTRYDEVGALLAALDAADPSRPVHEAPLGWRVRLPHDDLGEVVA